MEPDLEPLIDEAKQGNEQALLTLFDRHRGRLTRMVTLRMDRRIQSRVAASDVLQEAYLDLAAQLPNYASNPQLPFFLWVRRITGQRLAKIHRSHLGAQKRDAAREVRLGGGEMPEASSVLVAAELVGQFTSASAHAIREEMRLRVQEALESMPDDDRELISMRNIEQLSNEEIAVLLGISNKAASMRYTRAILRLKDMLEEIGMFD